jgi:hypothetical protein
MLSRREMLKWTSIHAFLIYLLMDLCTTTLHHPALLTRPDTKTEEATMVTLSTRAERFTLNRCHTDQCWVLPRMVAQFTLQFTAEAHHTMTVKSTSAMVLC